MQRFYFVVKLSSVTFIQQDLCAHCMMNLRINESLVVQHSYDEVSGKSEIIERDKERISHIVATLGTIHIY